MSVSPLSAKRSSDGSSQASANVPKQRFRQGAAKGGLEPKADTTPIQCYNWHVPDTVGSGGSGMK